MYIIVITTSFLFTWNIQQPINSLPTLTWNSTLSHAYNTSGLYKLTLEAVNAISSLYKEVVIQIFGKFYLIMIFKFISCWDLIGLL